jgi:hypothetical protein
MEDQAMTLIASSLPSEELNFTAEARRHKKSNNKNLRKWAMPAGKIGGQKTVLP